MFRHTSLSAHFLILAALCLWAYREKYKENLPKKILLWTWLLAISSMIHMYFIPMIVLIMTCTFIVEFVEDKKSLKSSILTFIISCIVTIAVIFTIGLDTSENYARGGRGTFNISLDTFINPQNTSLFIKDYKILRNGEIFGDWEAYGYLGLGVLVMCIIVFITAIYIFIKSKDKKIRISSNKLFCILCIVRSNNTCNRINCKNRRSCIFSNKISTFYRTNTKYL